MNEHEDSGNSGGGPDEEEEWTDMRSQEVDEAVDADMELVDSQTQPPTSDGLLTSDNVLADLKGHHLHQLAQRIHYRAKLLHSQSLADLVKSSVTTATESVGNLMTFNVVGLAYSAFSNSSAIKRVNQRIQMLDEVKTMVQQLEDALYQQMSAREQRLDGLAGEIDDCLLKGVELGTIARLVGAEEVELQAWLRRREESVSGGPAASSSQSSSLAFSGAADAAVADATSQSATASSAAPSAIWNGLEAGDQPPPVSELLIPEPATMQAAAVPFETSSSSSSVVSSSVCSASSSSGGGLKPTAPSDLLDLLL